MTTPKEPMAPRAWLHETKKMVEVFACYYLDGKLDSIQKSQPDQFHSLTFIQASDITLLQPTGLRDKDDTEYERLRLRVAELEGAIDCLQQTNATLRKEVEHRVEWNNAAIESAGIASAKISRLTGELNARKAKANPIIQELARHNRVCRGRIKSLSRELKKQKELTYEQSEIVQKGQAPPQDRRGEEG